MSDRTAAPENAEKDRPIKNPSASHLFLPLHVVFQFQSALDPISIPQQHASPALASLALDLAG